MDVRGTTTLGGVVAGVLERWLVVLVSFLIGVAGGVLLSVQASPSYVSTAYVQVYAIDRAPDMNTEQVFAGSGPVAARAAELLADGTTGAELSAATTVGRPQGSQILTFRTRLPDSARAADAANAFGRAYLEQRQKQLVAAGSPETTVAGVVVDSADPAEQPSGASSVAFIAAGGALGLLFGLVLAMLIDRFDPRVRTARRAQGLFYDQIFASGKDFSDTATALTVLTDRLAKDHESVVPSIALLGSNAGLAERVVPAFTAQDAPARRSSPGAGLADRIVPTAAAQHPSARTAASTALRNAPVVVNAAAMSSPAQQIAAAADSDLAIVLVTAQDNRAKVQRLADQASMITGRPCLGWYVEA